MREANSAARRRGDAGARVGGGPRMGEGQGEGMGLGRGPRAGKGRARRAAALWLLVALLAPLPAGCARQGAGGGEPTPAAAGTPGAPDGTADAAAPTRDAAADATATAVGEPPPFPATLVFDRTDVDRAWFTLERGLVQTTDGGLQWAVVEGVKAAPGQRFYTMGWQGGTLLAGGRHVLVRSTDGGTTWEVLPGHAETDLRGLTADPGDPDRALGLFAGRGVLATTDGGTTWDEVNTAMPVQAYGLWAVSFDPPRLATVDRAEGTILVSDDGAATWRPMATTAAPEDLLGLAAGDGILYAATGAGLRVSEDGGATWTERGPFPAMVTVASAPGDRDTILVVVPGGQVFRSRDRGRTWFDPNAPTRTPDATGGDGPRDPVPTPTATPPPT